jgi:hypothetical protein
MGQKRRPQQVAVGTGYDDDDKELDDSNEGHVTVAEHDYKRQVWQLKYHFKKLLDAACPSHTYPAKHKLKDCTMMKNFRTSGALSKGKMHKGDSGGKVATPFPEEEAVMAIHS